MNLFLNGLAILLAGLATLFVVGNYIAMIVRLRDKWRGITRRTSMVPVVPQLCLLIGSTVASFATYRFLPPWLFIAVALADPGLWYLAVSPFVSIFRR